jgi:hypothetical protein
MGTASLELKTHEKRDWGNAVSARKSIKGRPVPHANLKVPQSGRRIGSNRVSLFARKGLDIGSGFCTEQKLLAIQKIALNIEISRHPGPESLHDLYAGVAILLLLAD